MMLPRRMAEPVAPCRAGRVPRRRSVARAFSLLEIMAVISLLSVVSLLLAQLFQSTMSVFRHDHVVRHTATTWDEIIGEMRRDVWSSSAVLVADGRAMECRGPTGSRVKWHRSQRGGVVRAALGETDVRTRAWTDPPLALVFESVENGVVVSIEDLPSHGAARVTLVCQHLLLGAPR